MATDGDMTVDDGVAWLTAGPIHCDFPPNRRITADELLARGLVDEVAPVWTSTSTPRSPHPFASDLAEGVAAFLERRPRIFQGG